MSETQYGRPLVIGSVKDSAAQAIKRIRLSMRSDEAYTEVWLQKLISRYPNVLPIEQIEPAMTDVVPICMELPLASGFVDNLYATPDGDLIIGETKLFRNPEARRKVVAQIIDYAKDLSALSYENLQEKIFQAQAPDGSGSHPRLGLYETVASISGREEINEERFIDAVSQNLERGRFLLLVIGDGIQLGTENIANFLQQHAGMHFTFALVELAIFAMPSECGGGYLIQPRIIARTKNIDRAIVTIENGRIMAKAPPENSGNDTARPMTITEEKFYEQLAANMPDAVQRLKTFTGRLEGIGAAVEFGKNSMIIRYPRSDEKRPGWNMGYILSSGKFGTDTLNWQADAVGLRDLSYGYMNQLATLVPGAHVKKTPKPLGWYLAKGGTNINVDELLAHEDGWLNAIQQFTRAANETIKYQ